MCQFIHRKAIATTVFPFSFSLPNGGLDRPGNNNWARSTITNRSWHFGKQSLHPPATYLYGAIAITKSNPCHLETVGETWFENPSI